MQNQSSYWSKLIYTSENISLYLHNNIFKDFMLFLKENPQHAAKYSTHNSLSKI